MKKRFLFCGIALFAMLQVFAVDSYEFSVLSANTELGTVTGTNGRYQYGTQLTITANAAENCHFDHWIIEQIYSNDIPENAITVAEAYNIASSLSANEVTEDTYVIVGYVVSKYGSYYNSYCVADEFDGFSDFVFFGLDKAANIGDKIVVTAQLTNYNGLQPETKEGGNLTSVLQSTNYVYDNPYNLTLEYNTVATAIFSKDRYSSTGIYDFTVLSSNAELGTVSGDDGKYQYGTSHTITATPAEHCHFDHWIIEEIFSNDIPENTITVAEACSIASGLSINEDSKDIYYIVGYIISRGGVIYMSDEAEGDTNLELMLYGLTSSPNIGDRVVVIARLTNYYGKPETKTGGKVLQTLQSGSYVYDNPYTLTQKGNTVAIAVFSRDQNQICFSYVNGYISADRKGDPYPCYTVDYGETITVTVVPYEGYVFQQWDDGNTDNPRVFTVTGDVSYNAICIKDPCVLTLNSSNSEMGTAYGSGNYDRYTHLQIFAIPNPGYEFIGWSDGENANPRYLYLSESEMSLTANFVLSSSAQYVVDVTSQNPALGSATAVDYVLIEAIPFDGCTFVRWSDGNTDNPRYIELNADINLQAIFTGDPTSINAMSDSEKGTVRKIMVNGGLFIINDDNIYNSLGTQLK